MKDSPGLWIVRVTAWLVLVCTCTLLLVCAALAAAAAYAWVIGSVGGK